MKNTLKNRARNSVKPSEPPACATCIHYTPQPQQPPDQEPAGFCFGVPPAVLLRMDGQVTGAFPPVKAAWRCPNWRAN